MTRHTFSTTTCIFTFLFGVFLVVNTVYADNNNPLENPHEYRASSLLKPGVLQGKYYKIEEAVQYDGFFYHFSVSSDFGDFTAVSIPSLLRLLHELTAIAAMKDVETSDTALESAKQSGKNTVEGVINLFNDPEATIRGAGQGINSLFYRAKVTLGSRELTETEDNRFEQLIGLTKSKGEIANKYKVSVYSRNSVLQEQLKRLAMADYMGGISVGLATSAVSGVGGVVLSTSGAARLLNETINVSSPAELWLQNEEKLSAMGMHKDTVELFLNNPVFTPGQQSFMTAALEKLNGAGNRELFLKVGLQANTPEMAKLITDLAIMAAVYHQRISPLNSFSPMARILQGVKKDGTTVVLLPTDHIIWTEHVRRIASHIDESGKNGSTVARELWTLGSLSDLARSSLLADGWQIHEQAHTLLFPENSGQWPINRQP